MSTTWVFKQANIGIACEQAHDWATTKKGEQRKPRAV